MTWRTEIVELLPYVYRRRRPTTCDGYRSMSFKARRDPELRERYRCRRPAYWRFTALRRANFPARSGVYCWSHLLSRGLDGCPEEQDRHTRWWNAHLGEVNAIRTRHGYPPIEVFV